MKLAVDKPAYRALKTVGERKLAFQRYINEIVKYETEAKTAKYARDRRILRQLFDKHPNIHHYTKWGYVL
jgi:pre-mRNA-processing factor 40